MLPQCEYICKSGRRCSRVSSIDGFCITHFRMDRGHDLTFHYKTISMEIKLYKD